MENRKTYNGDRLDTSTNYSKRKHRGAPEDNRYDPFLEQTKLELLEATEYANELEAELGELRPELKRAKFDLDTYRNSLRVERELRFKSEEMIRRLQHELKQAKAHEKQLEADLAEQRMDTEMSGMEQQMSSDETQRGLNHRPQNDCQSQLVDARNAVGPVVPHTWCLDGFQEATLLDVLECVQKTYLKNVATVWMGPDLVFDYTIKEHRRFLQRTMMALFNVNFDKEHIILVISFDNTEICLQLHYKFLAN